MLSQNHLLMNNNFILRFIVAPSVVMFILLTANLAMAQTRAGAVTALSGDVRVERAGTMVPATLGMALDVGDRIITGGNSRVTITLTDNSKLELDESTTLVIDEHTFGANIRKTKLSLFSGLVRSFVSYTSSSAPNFDVHTPNAVASARGTEYDTSTGTQPPTTTSEEDRKKYKDCRRFTQVSVYEGTVEVTNTTNPSGGSVQVPPGHKTLVVCGLAPFPPSEISAAPAAAGATGNGLLLGGAAAVGVGGAFAGLAAGGAFGGGGGSTNKKVKSPSE
jgi:ferric-dicitrate binding protein FerR (iron transport regulator)